MIFISYKPKRDTVSPNLRAFVAVFKVSCLPWWVVCFLFCSRVHHQNRDFHDTNVHQCMKTNDQHSPPLLLVFHLHTRDPETNEKSFRLFASMTTGPCRGIGGMTWTSGFKPPCIRWTSCDSAWLLHRSEWSQGGGVWMNHQTSTKHWAVGEPGMRCFFTKWRVI